eukprot:CAMPEP_0194266536 /NCGR_PEP_ID=MMETSP0169-20130528/1408_1 /TAXON_ID=218684 /ORGANISM="Corethron pennatum, Strain L29A3" /LENGTH=267 /DNA_ID=CAMNT_0039007241 /DNA_START=132 /DNA_END=935 /DNA_ORIENTATION=+
MSSKLNELQNATVGMSVGVVEVACLQPFNYCKVMLQQGKPLSLDPAKLYRGVVPNMVNMGSCTMIQFAVGGSLKSAAMGAEKRALSAPQEMGCGLAAGVVSAAVGSPLELVMIQQQGQGGTLLQTLKNVAAPSIITRGFVGCAVREGLWTVGYLSVPPIVRRELLARFPDTFDTPTKARVPAALLGGLFACYLTQPFDTVKTCMQGDVARARFGTLRETAAVLWGESGVAGFYRGATFRYGRMVCAVFMMDVLQAAIGPMLYPKAFE